VGGRERRWEGRWEGKGEGGREGNSQRWGERERGNERVGWGGGSDEIYLPKTEMESVVETSVNRLLAVQVQLASISTPVTVLVPTRTLSEVVVSSGVGVVTIGLEMVRVIIMV
jgi:hypothetical protein